MRGILIHCLLATACAAGLAACGDDDGDDDDGQVSNAGKGGDSAGGTGGGGEAGTGGQSGTGGGSIACTEGGSECADVTPTGQPDGMACCTKAADLPPPMGTYATSRTVGVCGLHFPDRVPCFELAAPGVQNDSCPQNLDAGDGLGGLSMWGRHPGCCHAAFAVCGILQPDTGCTLFRPSAVKDDGTAIGGMGSGSYTCIPE